ncbi:MAG TPA: SRPBCC family protein [Nitrospiraceae bacterium]|nr:SRPBCC family protein [Nitrospiraceae bacterium]
MLTTVVSTEVNVPVRTAYLQWMQFEDFPQFMEGVKQVTQLDAKRLHWRAEIAGREKEWVAKIIEQTPDKRIAWTSRGASLAEAMVTFHPLSEGKSQILLRVGYTTEGSVTHVGDGMSAVSLRMQSDLERFKAFIEKRYGETMAGLDLKGVPHAAPRGTAHTNVRVHSRLHGSATSYAIEPVV